MGEFHEEGTRFGRRSGGVVRRVPGGPSLVLEPDIRHLSSQSSAAKRKETQTAAGTENAEWGQTKVGRPPCRVHRNIHLDRFFVPTPFDHGRSNGRESKRGAERVPVVTRYLSPAAYLSACLTPFSSSGQNSMPSWNTSLPQISSSS